MGAPPWQSRGTDLEVTDVEALAELPLPADEDELASVAMVLVLEREEDEVRSSWQRLKKRSADAHENASKAGARRTGERRDDGETGGSL